MAALLRNDRVRIILLNASLLLVFVSAWVSDRWPQFTLPAIVIAFVIVIGEAILLYVTATQAKSRIDDPTASTPKEVEYAPQHGGWFLAYEDEFGDTERGLSENRHYQYALLRHQHMLYALRPRASQASTWALASLYEHHSLAREFELRIARALELRRSHSELAKWKVIPQGDEAFKIVAGPFEIEYFHGLTNIRVLDPHRVTVEGKTRGTKSRVASPDLRPPRYQ